MKKKRWAEVIAAVAGAVGGALWRFLVFVLWVAGSAIEVLLHELNMTMKRFLFKDRQ